MLCKKAQQQLKTTLGKLKNDQNFKLVTVKKHMELTRSKMIQARKKLKTNNHENILDLTEKTLSDEGRKMIQLNH